MPGPRQVHSRQPSSTPAFSLRPCGEEPRLPPRPGPSPTLAPLPPHEMREATEALFSAGNRLAAGRKPVAPSCGSAQVLWRPRILADGHNQARPRPPPLKLQLSRARAVRRSRWSCSCGLSGLPVNSKRLHNSSTSSAPSSQVRPLRPRKTQIAGEVLRKWLTWFPSALANGLNSSAPSAGAMPQCAALRAGRLGWSLQHTR